MKASYYNHYADNKGKNVICFNSRLDSFCILSNNDARLLKEDVDRLAVSSPKIYNALVEKGFIIEDDRDELEELKEQYKYAAEQNHTFRLTILPSLDCNLRCWYCFEKHIHGSHMSEEVADNIFKFVKRQFEENEDLNYLEVEMFGGEPLLYLEEELYPLLKRIKDYVASIDKHVFFFFVTNAVCINERTLPLLNDLNASFQISIDGFKDRHDKVKFIPETGEGTYDSMIKTIHDITKTFENTYINLRINYDGETITHMPELIEALDDVDRNKIGIHLERVWQTGDQADRNNKELKRIINLWMAKGFKVSYMNLSRRPYSCKASTQNQVVLSCDGAVYKCTGRDFTEDHRDGRLNSDGTITWKEDKLRDRMEIVTYDNPMCSACKLMPLCWGPCCQKQMESGGADLARYCQKLNMEMTLEDYIRYRFNNAIVSNYSKEKL